MSRLYTPEQAKRAFRKEIRKREFKSLAASQDGLFDLLDDRFVPASYLDILSDLYGAGCLSEESFDEAYDAIYLYYGDILMEFLEEIEDEFN